MIPNIPALFSILRPTLRSLLLIPLILSAGPLATGVAKAKSTDCVILLHGLGRTADSMDDMAEALQSAGFITVNIDYPSREFPIEKLAVDAITRGIRQCSSNSKERIHFVTHSMGGILVRYYLTQSKVPALGRVVMLSPPNQGSEVVDQLKDKAFYQWSFGPAGQQLGTNPDGFVFGLGPVTYPVGIITGSDHNLFDSWSSRQIPGANDGKVSVERAKVEGMSDFLVLPHDHTFIMNQKDVIEQTIHFLRHGRFQAP